MKRVCRHRPSIFSKSRSSYNSYGPLVPARRAVRKGDKGCLQSGQWVFQLTRSAAG
jgi:hypothetical protein